MKTQLTTTILLVAASMLCQEALSPGRETEWFESPSIQLLAESPVSELTSFSATPVGRSNRIQQPQSVLHH